MPRYCLALLLLTACGDDDAQCDPGQVFDSACVECQGTLCKTTEDGCLDVCTQDSDCDSDNCDEAQGICLFVQCD